MPCGVFGPLDPEAEALLERVSRFARGPVPQRGQFGTDLMLGFDAGYAEALRRLREILEG